MLIENNKIQSKKIQNIANRLYFKFFINFLQNTHKKQWVDFFLILIRSLIK